MRSKELKPIEQDEQGIKEKKSVELITSGIIDASEFLDDNAKAYTIDHLDNQRKDHGKKSGVYQGKHSRLFKMPRKEKDAMKNQFHPQIK